VGPISATKDEIEKARCSHETTNGNEKFNYFNLIFSMPGISKNFVEFY
jgi:hypothetical protein